jgi:AcrR family transcriptional regulator
MPRSRRRGAALEGDIRAAVLELVVERGAAGVTMGAVATRVGTSKPVLYRRWPNRAALLRDALVPLAMDAIAHTDTGSYRGDMIAVLRGWSRFFSSPAGAIGPAIVGAMPHDPELADAFRQGVIGWRKDAMADIIARAVARGEK